VPATRKPVIGRLGARRGAGRMVTVRVGLARTQRLSLVIRDQRSRVIGRRTLPIRRADLFNVHVRVRPHGTVTARTRWRVVATAAGPPGQRTRKTARFSARG
jgi:hypothetical protein